MRICHVLTNESGGGLVYAEALARGSESRGAEVAWLTLGSANARGLTGLRSLGRACSSADVIHCHGFRAAVAAAPFSRRLIVTPHGSHLLRRTTGPRYRLALAAAGTAAHRAAAVICVGEDELQDLSVALWRDTDKLHLIRNGSKRVPLPTTDERSAARRALGIGESAPVLAFVGRLEPQKDPLLAALSFEHIRALLPAAQLLLAGGGSLGPQVKALDVDGVHHLGSVADAQPVLVAADAVLNTSRWEGMALSLLEAMWRGRPAVAVAAAGNAETIADAGVLVASRQPREIGAAAAALLDDASRLAALASRARRRAELLFDEERMVDETLAVYERCLRRPARRPRRVARLAGMGSR